MGGPASCSLKTHQRLHNPFRVKVSFLPWPMRPCSICTPLALQSHCSPTCSLIFYAALQTHLGILAPQGLCLSFVLSHPFVTMNKAKKWRRLASSLPSCLFQIPFSLWVLSSSVILLKIVTPVCLLYSLFPYSALFLFYHHLTYCMSPFLSPSLQYKFHETRDFVSFLIALSSAPRRCPAHGRSGDRSSFVGPEIYHTRGKKSSLETRHKT